MAFVKEKKYLYSPAGLEFFCLGDLVSFFPNSKFSLLFLTDAQMQNIASLVTEQEKNFIGFVSASRS